MSEYWVSTPKYECKYCKVFVKETKVERANHENGPRHQGNLRRALRHLHKTNEYAERDKQAAKDEVARLNGAPRALRSRDVKPLAPQVQPQISEGERKQQLEQLVGMGVAVPQEYRGEMALAGNWETVEVQQRRRPRVDPDEDGDEGEDRKRKFKEEEVDDEAEEAEANPPAARRAWTATQKTYPVKKEEGVDELDDLLSGTLPPQTEDVSKDSLGPVPPQDRATQTINVKEEEAEPSTDEAAVIKTQPVDEAKPVPEAVIFKQPRRGPKSCPAVLNFAAKQARYQQRSIASSSSYSTTSLQSPSPK